MVPTAWLRALLVSPTCDAGESVTCSGRTQTSEVSTPATGALSIVSGPACHTARPSRSPISWAAQTFSTPTNSATSWSAGALKTSVGAPHWRSRPSISTATRSARRSASPRSCVTSTVVGRVSARIRAKSSSSCPRVGASTPAKGSSSSSTSGRAAKALARLTRWASPPESDRARRRDRLATPKRSSHSWASRRRSRRPTPRRRSGSSTFSRTDMLNSNGSWKAADIRRRVATGLAVIGSPSSSSSPLLGGSRSCRVASNVLLPAPLGPITAVTSRRGSSSSGTLSTRRPPRSTTRSRISMCAPSRDGAIARLSSAGAAAQRSAPD